MLDSLIARLAQWDLQGDRAIVRWLARCLFKPLQSETVRHIVVYRVGNIGDTVVAIPALCALREAFPQATITLLTSSGSPDLPGATGVLEAFPGLANRVISYLPPELKSLAGLRQLKNRVLESGSVDWWVDLPVSMQTFQRGLQEIFLARWLHSRSASGFDLLLPEWGKPAFARQFPGQIPKTSDWLLCLVQASLAGFSAPSQPLKHFSPPPLALETLGLAPEKPILAVNAGAKLAIKRWEPAAFQACLAQVQAKLPELQLALLGSPAEQALNESIADGLSGSVANLAGKLSLAQTWSLLAQADAVLSNDTGTMHMAGLLNKPVFAPMSGQYPAPLWHPPGETLSALRHPVSCAPCFKDVCPLSEQLCLTRLSPVEMASRIVPLMQAGAHREPLT